MNLFQNPMILDPAADKDRVGSLLKKLLSQMEELQQRAFTYKSYQKNFKVGYLTVVLPFARLLFECVVGSVYVSSQWLSVSG